MTDLLTRTAARAAGETPVAAPRIPSRFEPLPEELGLPEPVVPEPAEAVPPAPAAAPMVSATRPQGRSLVAIASADPPVTTPPLSTVAPSLSPATVAASVTVAASAAAPSSAAAVQRRETHSLAGPPVQAESVPMAIAAPSADAAAPDRAEAPAAAMVTESRAPPAARSSRDAERPVAPIEVSAHQIVASPEYPGEAAAANVMTAVVQPSTATPPLAKIAEPVRTTGLGPPPDAVVPATTFRAVEGRRPAPHTVAASAFQPAMARSPVAPPRPVIEIHIGSIEVRAASAPAPPAARTAPASTSLDTFLSRGRGA
jgi:hypothetical protein